MHRLEFCWQPVPCSGGGNRKRPLAEFRTGPRNDVVSGAGTNLKVESHTRIFLSCPFTFVVLQIQLSHFGERFRDGQYSLVCCFSTHGASPPSCPSYVQVGWGACRMKYAPIDVWPMWHRRIMTAVRNNGQFIPLNNASHAVIIHL